MPRRKFNPADPAITAEIIARLESMTPEELYRYVTYRKPGIPETDMTGLFPVVPIPTWEELQAQRAQEAKPTKPARKPRSKTAA